MINEEKFKELKNETLAQLGDAILELVIVEYFYDKGYDKQKIQKEVEKWFKWKFNKNKK